MKVTALHSLTLCCQKFLLFFMKNENTLSAKKKWFSQTSICVLLCFLCGGKNIWRASNVHLRVCLKVWKQGYGFLSILPRGKKKPVVLTLAIPSPQIPISVLHWKQLLMVTERNGMPSRNVRCICGGNELTISVWLCENCPQSFYLQSKFVGFCQ